MTKTLMLRPYKTDYSFTISFPAACQPLKPESSFFVSNFSYYMLYGSYRVIQNHSRTSPTHHFAHSLFHLRAIAVDGTLLARRLVFAKLAAFQS